MIISGHLQSKWNPPGFTLTLQETWNVHDSMNIPKIEFNTYIYIFYKYLIYKKNIYYLWNKKVLY